jgi:hypothetical protein
MLDWRGRRDESRKTRGPRETIKRTERRRASAQAARRLAKEAAEREWRLFLTTKFERTGRGLTRFHAKVGAARFRDLMADVPDALDEIRSPDQRGVAEFHVLLGGDDFHAFLAELTEALESGSDPGAFWARTTLAKLAAPAGPRTPWRTRRPPALPWRT